MPHDGARRDSLLFGDNLVDLSGARELAVRDKHQFQWWAVSLVDTVPQGGKKKGADRGIDGIRWVRTGPRRGDLGQMIVSVKAGGNVSVRDVRDLAGTAEREKAAGGILITGQTHQGHAARGGQPWLLRLRPGQVAQDRRQDD